MRITSVSILILTLLGACSAPPAEPAPAAPRQTEAKQEQPAPAAAEQQPPAPTTAEKPKEKTVSNEPESSEEAPGVDIRKNIVYGKGGDVDLMLDLARPAEGDGPFPLVVCIHGGGWHGGARQAHHPEMLLLARNGYVAATVSYRFAPKHKFPAQVCDVKCAVRYLRSRAAELNINPKRVGAAGGSAGGHLALMLGLMNPEDDLEGDGGNPDQPSKVQAVANFCGPTDFKTWRVWPSIAPELEKGFPGGLSGLVKNFLGTADCESEIARKASPTSYVGKGDPPVLTATGQEDPLVPLQQAELLHERLRKAGVAERLVVLKGAGHGWGEPQKTYTDHLMLEFFDRHLKGAPRPELKQDIVYGKGADVDLKLDLVRPTTGTGPYPAVVCIHGGGWTMGNKSSYRSIARLLANNGYVAVTIQYRFSPDYAFPAQIEDCKCAVRYVRAHAEELNVDPKRVGAVGSSAGGHLSLLLGLMNPEDGLEGSGGWQDQPSKVQAVVNHYGPTDFTVGFTSLHKLPGMKFASTVALAQFLGTIDMNSPEFKRVSPVNHIDRGDPPVLTLHGSDDTLVPVEQAKRLDAALKKAGAPSTLVILKGAHHGWGGEKRAYTNRLMLEFFDKHLKAPPK